MNEKLIESVLIAQIHIANPRARNRARWQMMVANIREVGLKKPITVVRRNATGEDGKLYDLVCGQGWVRTPFTRQPTATRTGTAIRWIIRTRRT